MSLESRALIGQGATKTIQWKKRTVTGLSLRLFLFFFSQRRKKALTWRYVWTLYFQQNLQARIVSLTGRHRFIVVLVVSITSSDHDFCWSCCDSCQENLNSCFFPQIHKKKQKTGETGVRSETYWGVESTSLNVALLPCLAAPDSDWH